MPDKQQTKLDKLAKLQEKYIALLPEKLSVIHQLWLDIKQDRKNEARIHKFTRLVHSIAGSAGTFGFAQMGSTCRKLENTLNQLQEKVTLSRAEQANIDNVLTEIDGLVERGPDVKQYAISEPMTRSDLSTADDQARLIYVVEDDELLTDEIATQLKHFGFQVIVFHDATQAMAAIEKHIPSAMILDIQLPEGDLAGPELASQFNDFSDKRIPLIFMSTRDDWNARLAVVRAGGDAYFTKPIDFTELLDRLDLLINDSNVEPYRILVVDDMEILAEHYATSLRNVGMVVEIVSDPTTIFNVIAEFKPELILMDIYMPECSGLEAAKVIRQKEELISVPIVFLSTEKDIQQQQSALQIGGDDFLQKPVADDRLIAGVNVRVERFRKLRSLMQRDSLTGLLNHVTIKLHLESEIIRSLRQQSTLVFAMLDIDKFKLVNDSYGHQAGDRVIKSLSRLLLRRLRKSDVVGRYGGEEFAIVLLDTNTQAATEILNDIREQFTKITHQTEDTQFTCSFSAGLATLPPITEINQLIYAADQALYMAKESGRNRICISENKEAAD